MSQQNTFPKQVDHMRPKPVPFKYQDFPGPFKAYRPTITRPFLRRGRIRFVSSIVVFSLLIVATFVIDLPAGVAPIIALMPFFMLSMMFSYIGSPLRWSRRLLCHDWLLCTKCAYPLKGLEPEGQCPEGGNPYTHASTEWAWRVFCNVSSGGMDPPPPLPSNESSARIPERPGGRYGPLNKRSELK